MTNTQKKQIKSWNIFYEMMQINQDCMKHFGVVAEINNRIKYLTECSDQKMRLAVYKDANVLDQELFNKFVVFLKEAEKRAQQHGFQNVYSWVMDDEEDTIDWLKMLDSERYQQAIKKFAGLYSETKRQNMRSNNFYISDYWYQKFERIQFDLQHTPILKSHDEALVIAKDFFIRLGFEDIIGRIEFIKDDQEQTRASIGFKNKEWTTKIFLSQATTNVSDGSWQYLSNIIHEIGHVIQARHIQDPDKFYCIAPNPLSEIISTFFQKLHAQSDLGLKVLPETINRKDFNFNVGFQLVEQLIRELFVLEFEWRLYQILNKTADINAHQVAELYARIQCQYHGYQELHFEDHLWQRLLYYLLNFPYRSRTYIIGEVFAQEMTKNIMRTSAGQIDEMASKKYLKNQILTCSDKGLYNTWKDYKMACGIPKVIDENFMIKKIEEEISFLEGLL